MRGQGLPPFNGGHKGDQLVKVMIEIPRKITDAQVAAVQKLHETATLDAYPKHHAYADRLKRWQQS
jgi:DnaJ-class molecular chaperone